MEGDNVVQELQIKNFRSLKDTGSQKLAPITLLVGENSSGKSSFLRSFPLLKQSISKKTSGPILWAGDVDDYVDFGSFEETVTNDGSTAIGFKFKFTMNNLGIFYLDLHELNEVIDVNSIFKGSKIEYEITISQSRVKEYVSQFSLSINSEVIDFDLKKNSLTTENMYYRSGPQEELSQILGRNSFPRYGYMRAFSNTFGFALPNIDERWEELNERLSQLVQDENLEKYLIQLVIIIGAQLTKQQALSPIGDSDPNVNSSFIQRYNKIVEILQNNMHIADLIKLCYVYCTFFQIDDYIQRYFSQVHYIAPLRATAERYYRLRNLAVDDIDYQGKNLAIFINSLPLKRMKEFQTWTKENFGFAVKTNKSKGHISLQIELDNSTKAINLSDTGFGYSQILPIITQLWELSSQKNDIPPTLGISGLIPLVIAIEQPELHLHPAVQGRLSKAFISCIQLAKENGFELQLLLETHSETIVNYMGRAIAKGLLKPDDVSVILFEKQEDTGITVVKNSSYDKDGYLTNWPYGFFNSEE